MQIIPENGMELTFIQFHQQIQRYAKGFLSLGLERNDMVLFFADNSLDLLTSQLANIYLGVVFSPMTPANGPYEMSNHIHNARGTILFVDRQRVEKILLPAMDNEKYCSAVKRLKMLIIIDSNDDTDAEMISKLSKHPMSPKSVVSMKRIKECREHLEQIPFFERNKDDHLMIVYTSGTTGQPKGVIYTHHSARSMIETNTPILMNCRFSFWYPFGHISGAMFSAYNLCHGITLVIEKEPILDKLLSSVEKYGIEELAIAPGHATQLIREDYRLKYNLQSLRVLVFGGSKIPKEQLIEIRNRYNVIMHELYGSTELLHCAYNTGDDVNEPVGSVGPPSPYCEMKIIDLETGKNLPANCSGEICFRGPHLFIGYFHNEEATAKAIDSRGWYHTGDLGHYDERGNLYIIDRIKEMIKFRYWSIWPYEIEEYLLENPAIDSCCAVGVKHQTDGQWLRAYVVIRPGHQVTEQELIKNVQGNLEFT